MTEEEALERNENPVGLYTANGELTDRHGATVEAFVECAVLVVDGSRIPLN